MLKHILGQAFFQVIILFIFVFAGHLFIPEGVEGIHNLDPNLGITKDLVLTHPNPVWRSF
jgi:hypothetical protein